MMVQTSTSFYRNCATALVAHAGNDWQQPGAASSTSFIPIWGNLFKQNFDQTGVRTVVTALWGIEWSQGDNATAGVRLCIINDGPIREIAAITKDLYAQFNPETSGVWISAAVQDLIDRGANGGILMQMRGGCLLYGSHLHFAYSNG